MLLLFVIVSLQVGTRIAHILENTKVIRDPLRVRNTLQMKKGDVVIILPKCVCFCLNDKICDKMKEHFAAKHIDALVLKHEQSDETKKDIADKLRNGKTQVICVAEGATSLMKCLVSVRGC